MVVIGRVLSGTVSEVGGARTTLVHRLNSVQTNHTGTDLLSHVRIRCCKADAPIGRLTSVAVPRKHVLLIAPCSGSDVNSVRHTVCRDSLNVGPTGSNGIVHLIVPTLASRHHGRLTGAINGRGRTTGVSVHGVHHSTVRTLGGTRGGGRVARSRLQACRGGMRRFASGSSGRVSGVATSGRGRVLSIWRSVH